MKVLVIGSGGREHAICHTFAKSEHVSKLFCANGNAGIAAIAECVAISPTDSDSLLDFAIREQIGLTFVGGESTLVTGIVDKFEAKGLRIVGPSQAATRLESSKTFSKDFMARHGIPTAKYSNANSPSEAVAVLEAGEFGDEGMPVVVKADGLAAGKGVVVAKDRAEAVAAINDMAELVGADAAERIVLEECLFGKEVSLLMFADRDDYVLMPPTRDHKRIGEGDTGPNTGGMGTITDSSLLFGDEIEDIKESIIEPTLRGCIDEGFRFRGILFLGLMMTESGPKLLEYNVRFGDPETQAILVRLETDLVDICEAMIDGRLSSVDVEWQQGSSACVVLASENYPAKPRTGDVINGLDDAVLTPNTTIFHAGTSSLTDGEYFTAGGRVLGVTSTGDSLDEALATAYSAAAKISWKGMQYRRDIGK
ncbi:MAG TPA: phosphoribosylamine--glycine ligase [Pyrinomonadaceae bacterium]|nr:phosphoribosylamine--glycine ligase [Pyrinomonadaceae bacterium]